METNNLTPENSFKIITQIINEARNKFEENGFIYIFWGILITLASISQFILLKNEYYNINYYPYFVMPIGGLFTGYYFYKKNAKKYNQISRIISFAWITLTINIMILSFLFFPVLKENLTPIILILLSCGIIVSGASIRSRLLLISGISINISAFVCFNLEWIYHPLLLGIISVVAILIPGIILMIKYKKQQNV